jgi:hypothetical protein
MSREKTIRMQSRIGFESTLAIPENLQILEKFLA